jgi:hypothetical protein
MTVTTQDTLTALADNVVHREREVHQYQINIDNYTVMLTALPQDDWPTDIAQYKTTLTENIPYSVSMETVQLIADYQYRDRLSYLLRTENIEQSKTKRVLEALKAQIPADQLAQMVADAKAKIDAV